MKKTTTQKTTLITGGTGFIGSHTSIAMINAGHKIVILDNLSNSQANVISQIRAITGANEEQLTFIEGDLLDIQLLENLFCQFQIDLVIHFAALKAVGESVEQPIRYYQNNVTGTLNLLNAMQHAQTTKLVFSSSATVYGDPITTPINESHPISKATNAYGQSKIIIERILEDLCNATSHFSVACLRYFNPAGAHESGLIGENPNGTPNNLMPYLSDVATGKLPHLNVYGDDYATPDGTGVRDYIHVMDLAEGHLAACDYLNKHDSGLYTWNLGTGQGYSVLEMIKAFEQVSDVSIPYKITARRSGDISQCFANCDKAKKELGWSAQRNLTQMMTDTWRWLKTSNINSS